jgi:hypothetical protein
MDQYGAEPPYYPSFGFGPHFAGRSRRSNSSSKRSAEETHQAVGRCVRGFFSKAGLVISQNHKTPPVTFYIYQRLGLYKLIFPEQKWIKNFRKG